jgi:hypothetical protein
VLEFRCVSWDLKFYEPVQVPGKRKQLVTLSDAALYVTKLPKSEREAEHWRPAAILLKLIGEQGGCRLLARMSVVHGLRKGVTPEPEFDYFRKSPSFTKHKLKRDE